MRNALPIWLTLGMLLLSACGGGGTGTGGEEAASNPGPPVWHRARSLGSTYELAWRPEVPPLLSNEPTSLRVNVLRLSDDTPVEGAEIVMRGSMPGHGHGMNREPRSREVGDGDYLVEGVLLHMSGHWELKFDVVADGVAETTTFELELE